MTDRVVIVGAGQAGARAAEALRKGGFAAPISIYGDEAHEPYERPVLSKEGLASNGNALTGRVFPRPWYAQQGIDLHTSQRITAVDATAQRVISEGGESVAYAALLLCTGSRPRKLDLGEKAHYLRTAQDCEQLRGLLATGKPLLVIGGGFIGLEVAAAARARGLEVTVCEQQPTLLSRVLPEVVSSRIAALHRERGVSLQLEHDVSSHSRVAATKVVVVGVGVAPNSELAADAGAVVANGVVVDEYCRTSLPNVYAAGDVTNHFNPLLGRRLRLESWQNAQNQAIAAANNIAGKPTIYAEVPWFWSDQYDINIQMVGVMEPGMQLVWRGDRTAFGLIDERLVFAVGFNAGGDIRLAKRLIEIRAAIPGNKLADLSLNLKDLVRRQAVQN